VALGLFRASAAHATPSDGAPTAPSGTATLVQVGAPGAIFRCRRVSRRAPRGPSASWGMRASCFASTSRCVSSRRA